MADLPPKMFLPSDVAKVFQYSVAKINKMCKDGEIKAIRYGRGWRICHDWYPAYMARMERMKWNTDSSSTVDHGPQHGESAATQDGLPCEPRIVARQNAA